MEGLADSTEGSVQGFNRSNTDNNTDDLDNMYGDNESSSSDYEIDH